MEKDIYFFEWSVKEFGKKCSFCKKESFKYKYLKFSNNTLMCEKCFLDLQKL